MEINGYYYGAAATPNMLYTHAEIFFSAYKHVL